jgi:hypothetical protein
VNRLEDDRDTFKPVHSAGKVASIVSRHNDDRRVATAMDSPCDLQSFKAPVKIHIEKGSGKKPFSDEPNGGLRIFRYRRRQTEFGRAVFDVGCDEVIILENENVPRHATPRCSPVLAEGMRKPPTSSFTAKPVRGRRLTCRVGRCR